MWSDQQWNTINSDRVQTDVQFYSDNNLAEIIIPVQSEVKTHPCDQINDDNTDITKNSDFVQINLNDNSDNEFCDYTSNVNDTLQRHIENVHEKISFPCKFCDYKSDIKYNLAEHIRAIHEKTVFTCTVCECTSNNMKELQMHTRIAHEDISENDDQDDKCNGKNLNDNSNSDIPKLADAEIDSEDLNDKNNSEDVSVSKNKPVVEPILKLRFNNKPKVKKSRAKRNAAVNDENFLKNGW